MLNITDLKEVTKICLFNASYSLGHPLCDPDTLQISLTNRCNLSCKMCSVHKYTTPKSQEMPLEEVKKIIAVAKKQFGTKRLILTGGEPLLLGNDIIEMVRFAREQSMAVIITTNAFFMEEYAFALADAGVGHFHISIDGLREAHNDIRGSQLSFDKAVSGIRLLADIRNKNNYKFSIGVATVILKNNIKDIYDLYMYVDKLNVDLLDLFPYLPDNTDFSNTDYAALWPNSSDLDEFARVYNNIYNAKTRHIKTNQFFDIRLIMKYYKKKISSKDWRCFAGFKNLFITMSDLKRRGRFEPCLFMCKEHISVRDHDYNLRKIWNSYQAKRARIAIKKCDVHCYQNCFSLPSVFKIINRK